LNALAVDSNNLTGTIPNEIGGASSLYWLDLSSNSLTGTIPSVLGALSNLTDIRSSYNSLTGTIPSELGLLPSLLLLNFDNNLLTGSIPIELLNKNSIFTDFYGNSLSNLTAVDGEEICSAGGGEVYCDCASNCFNPEQCGCEEAKSCCSPFLEQYTECILCSSGEIKFPWTYIELYMSTCYEFSYRVRNNYLEYGTEEVCDDTKLLFQDLGCYCTGGQNNGSLENSATEDSVTKNSATEDSVIENLVTASQITECVICSSGAIENPDTYLDLHSASCQEMSNYIKNDLTIYGTEEVCDEAKLWFKGVCCFCSGE